MSAWSAMGLHGSFTRQQAGTDKWMSLSGSSTTRSTPTVMTSPRLHCHFDVTVDMAHIHAMCAITCNEHARATGKSCSGPSCCGTMCTQAANDLGLDAILVAYVKLAHM